MDNGLREKKFWISFGIGAFVVFGLWIGSACIIFNIYPNLSDSGTFGDTFGAINALFSGWAFLGVIVAIILQKKELEEQRKEIRESRIAHQESAGALADQAKLSAIRTRIEALTLLIEDVNRRIDSTQIGRVERGKLQMEHRKLMNELRKRLDEVDIVSKSSQLSENENAE